LELIEILDYSSIVATLIFFSLGSYKDLKTREVSDKVWLIYGPIGLALTLGRLILNPPTLVVTIASIGLGTLFSFALFYFGLFGGADAKAIICLSATVPLFPSSYAPLMGYVHPFFPIVVVILGFVCSLSVAVWVTIRNLSSYASLRSGFFEGLEREPAWKKGVAFITGYRTSLSRLTSTYYLYPMEEVVEESDGSRRRFHLFFSAEADRDQLVSKLADSLHKVGSPNEVWVSPGIPMLVFVLVGLVIALVFGDPIFTTIFLMGAR
jgi:preflagellin peptidase FlaK